MKTPKAFCTVLVLNGEVSQPHHGKLVSPLEHGGLSTYLQLEAWWGIKHIDP